MKYFNKATRSELLTGLEGATLAYLNYDANNPDHVELANDNPFFSALPEGKQLTFTAAGIPNGLEDIPAVVLTPVEAAQARLLAVGVTSDSLAVGMYLDAKGFPEYLETVDAALAEVAGTTGLTLAEVATGLLAFT
jgi:hypothetical protein